MIYEYDIKGIPRSKTPSRGLSSVVIALFVRSTPHQKLSAVVASKMGVNLTAEAGQLLSEGVVVPAGSL